MARLGASLGLLVLFAVFVWAAARLVLAIHGPVFRSPVDTLVVSATGPDGERHQAIYRQLVMAKAIARNSKEPKALAVLQERVREYFNLSPEMLREIALIGADEAWPGPRKGELFLPVEVVNPASTPSVVAAAPTPVQSVKWREDAGQTQRAARMATQSGAAPPMLPHSRELLAAGRAATSIAAGVGTEGDSMVALAGEAPAVELLKAGTDVIAANPLPIHWQFRLRDAYAVFKRDSLTPPNARVRVLRVEVDTSRYLVEVFPAGGDPAIGRGWIPTHLLAAVQ